MKRILFTVMAVCLSAVSVFANLDSGLIAFYPFENNAQDESGNGHHGAVVGPTISDQGRDASNAYYFDGVNDYITLPNALLSGLSQGTVAMWVKIQATATHQVPFCVNGVDAVDSKWLSVSSPGIFWYFTARSKLATQNQSYPYDGNWHFIAGTWSDSEVALWLDGVKIGFGAPLSAGTTVTSIWLGNSVSNRSYWTKGLMDNVRFYNRPLSSQEVSALYNFVPLAGSDYIDIGSIADTDNNGSAEAVFLKVDDNGFPSVNFMDMAANQYIRSINIFDSTWIPKTLRVIADMNGNNVQEISVLAAKKSTGESWVYIKDGVTGAVIKQLSLP